MTEPQIHKAPYAIGIGKITEHEDGSATYEIHMSSEASAAITELGLQLVFYCAASGTDIQDALDGILTGTINKHGVKDYD
jgi:hypothetical protein